MRLIINYLINYPLFDDHMDMVTAIFYSICFLWRAGLGIPQVAHLRMLHTQQFQMWRRPACMEPVNNEWINMWMQIAINI